MCYFHLSILNDFITENQIEQLNNYFGSLVGSAVDNITISKVSRAMNISSEQATKIMAKCKEAGIVKTCFAIRCPECYGLIKKINTLTDIPRNEINCYNCDKDVEITSNDIEVLFSLVDSSVFHIGQQVISNNIPATPVAQEDNLNSILLAGSVNEFLFSPSEDEYNELRLMCDSIFISGKTDKETGDKLEGLVKYLFCLCPAFETASINTSTNQIDCYVRNKLFLKFGVLKDIGAGFFIECKNEERTPSGSYMSKLHSIIRNTNAKTNIFKLGIIIYKKQGPKTFKGIASKIYLSEAIIMIAINGKEIKELVEKRGNLLELIERKIDEIILDSTTDLKKAGVYCT